MLQADGVLAHYDEKKTLVLVCDASPYGVGALRNHMEPDGREAPICFASKTLISTERNYAQIDKEALAVVYAAKKFNQYVLRREFVIYTDHKPLLELMHHSRLVPQMISPCMLRWSVTGPGRSWLMQKPCAVCPWSTERLRPHPRWRYCCWKWFLKPYSMQDGSAA